MTHENIYLKHTKRHEWRNRGRRNKGQNGRNKSDLIRNYINVNRLNTAIKRQRLGKWTFLKNMIQSIISTRDTFYIQR